MSGCDINGDGMFFVNIRGEAVCLISFWTFYKNRGTIPLNPIYALTDYVLPVILGRLRETYLRLAGEKQDSAEETAYMTAVAMVFEQSFLGYRPLRILETGGGSGVLAGLLAAAGREAHPESRAYGLFNEIHAAPLIDTLKRLEKDQRNLKILGDTPESRLLADAYFDMTVISGRETKGNPEKIVSNLLRITRPGGCLVCLTEGNLSLRDQFLALPGAAPQAYEIAENHSVLVKQVAAGDYAEPAGPRQELEALHARLREQVGDGGVILPDALRAAISILKRMEILAIRLFDVADIHLKQRVNDAKENALNALYTPDDGFRRAYTQRLRAFAADMGG